MYINDRDRVLQELVDAGVSNRNLAKKLIIKVLNGGSVNDINVPWWKDMCTQFTMIALKVANHKDHKKILDLCEKVKGQHNLFARTMSTVLNNVENQCLELLYTFLNDHKCVPNGRCVLIFDGMMIPDTPAIRAKVTGGTFLADASKYIYEALGYNIEIKIKEFDEAFELPEGYADKVDDILVLDGKDDDLAADEFAKRYKDRLITCEGRVFWDEGNGIFTDDTTRVKKGVLNTVRKMKIFMRGNNTLIPYSGDATCAKRCVEYVLADSVYERPDFVENLFESSINYLAFEDGVYSFEAGELLPYPVPGVYFMNKINRPFPVNVDPSIKQQVITPGRVSFIGYALTIYFEQVVDKVLLPAFPNEEQWNYYLYRLSRAMAGNVHDKRWHICIGERDSSKVRIASRSLCTIRRDSFRIAYTGRALRPHQKVIRGICTGCHEQRELSEQVGCVEWRRCQGSELDEFARVQEGGALQRDPASGRAC